MTYFKQRGPRMSLGDLPDELLLMVLESKVFYFEDILNARQCSKRFRKLISSSKKLHVGVSNRLATERLGKTLLSINSNFNVHVRGLCVAETAFLIQGWTGQLPLATHVHLIVPDHSNIVFTSRNTNQFMNHFYNKKNTCSIKWGKTRIKEKEVTLSIDYGDPPQSYFDMIGVLKKLNCKAKRLFVNKVGDSMHIPTFKGEEFTEAFILEDIETLDLGGFNNAIDLDILFNSKRMPVLPNLKKVFMIDPIFYHEEFDQYNDLLCDIRETIHAWLLKRGKWKMTALWELEWVRV